MCAGVRSVCVCVCVCGEAVAEAVVRSVVVVEAGVVQPARQAAVELARVRVRPEILEKEKGPTAATVKRKETKKESRL